MGTIFVELVMRRPFLVAETDMGQLKRMFEVLGTPNPEEWPVSGGGHGVVAIPMSPT